MQDQLQEITRHIKTIKGSVPAHRHASKHQYSFSASSFEQQLAVWDQVWQSKDDFWIRAHAFFFLERNMNKPGALQVMWQVIVKWQDQGDAWPLFRSFA